MRGRTRGRKKKLKSSLQMQNKLSEMESQQMTKLRTMLSSKLHLRRFVLLIIPGKFVFAMLNDYKCCILASHQMY